MHSTVNLHIYATCTHLALTLTLTYQSKQKHNVAPCQYIIMYAAFRHTSLFHFVWTLWIQKVTTGSPKFFCWTMYTGVVTWSEATLLSLSVLQHDKLPFARFFVKCGQARPKHCNAFTAINGQEQKTCPSYLWISLERTRLTHRRKDSSRVWHTYQGPSTHHDSALALCSTQCYFLCCVWAFLLPALSGFWSCILLQS